MNRKMKFPSMAGFSLTSAKGEKVKIGMLLNCKDDHPEELKLLLTQSTLDYIVYPEIIERAMNVKLPHDFQLRMAHILMYGDESKNEVLLNDDVRFLALVSMMNEERQFKSSEPINYADINDIFALYPSKKNNPNAAYIMLLKHKGRWHYACNLVYNLELVRKKFEHSIQFFESAKNCLDKKHWGPLVYNLYSATELAIQSLLLLMHQGKFSVRQDHHSTSELFIAYTNNGNLDPSYIQHFSRLKELRVKGRYLTGVNSKKFQVEESEIITRFNLTNNLMNYITLLLHSRDISKVPSEGHIIALGKG